MKKILFFVLAILMVSSSSAASQQTKNQQKVENFSSLDTIIIPDDYPLIQQGINHSNPGDTILVRSGIYRENLRVNKERIIIRGENKFDTIIDGKKITDTINITAHNVTIQSFTIINGWNIDPYKWDVSGIKIFSPDVTVKENIITLNRLGINVIETATNLIITDNTFIDDGILLGNWVYTSNLTKESFFHTIANNTVNGRPVYYYKNQHDLIVPLDAGQVILVNCTNVTIKNLYLTCTDFSIILGNCYHCCITNVTVDKTDGEIILFLSENNIIENTTSSRSLHGICLDYESHNNTVRNNRVSDNWVGISVMNNGSNNQIYKNYVLNNTVGFQMNTQAHDNNISENIIVGCDYGITLNNANDNLLTKNILRKNTVKAFFIRCSNNIWDHNYWNRPRLLPKIIFGTKPLGKIWVPWINIDKHPLIIPPQF